MAIAPVVLVAEMARLPVPASVAVLVIVVCPALAFVEMATPLMPVTLPVVVAVMVPLPPVLALRPNTTRNSAGNGNADAAGPTVLCVDADRIGKDAAPSLINVQSPAAGANGYEKPLLSHWRRRTSD